MLALVVAVSLAVELPPEARLAPPPPAAPPSLVARVVLSSVAAVAGVGAALGLSYAFCGPTCFQNPPTITKGFGYTFSNAVLAGLLAAGLGYFVHQAFGGKGEVAIAMLVSLAVMAAAGVAASFIEPAVPYSMLVTAAIGAVPAAAGTVLSLELSQPRLRVSPTAVRGGGGLALSGEF